MSLVADNVTLLARQRPLLRDVCLQVMPGQVHALLGPNGAGKTSLLRLLSGDRLPDSGTVILEGRALPGWTVEALARQRAVQGQDDNLRFPLRVDEVVALGRLPHSPEPQANETRIVLSALSLCDVSALAHRRYLTLSGGERSRVRMARAFAQVWEQFETSKSTAPRYLLLDEPAAHLDIGHQHFAMQLLRRFAAAGGGVLVTLHDPNLALAYADRASLIEEGKLMASGTVSEVLTPALLEPAYGLGVQVLRNEAGHSLLAWKTGRANGDETR